MNATFNKTPCHLTHHEISNAKRNHFNGSASSPFSPPQVQPIAVYLPQFDYELQPLSLQKSHPHVTPKTLFAAISRFTARISSLSSSMLPILNSTTKEIALWRCGRFERPFRHSKFSRGEQRREQHTKKTTMIFHFFSLFSMEWCCTGIFFQNENSTGCSGGVRVHQRSLKRE